MKRRNFLYTVPTFIGGLAVGTALRQPEVESQNFEFAVVAILYNDVPGVQLDVREGKRKKSVRTYLFEGLEFQTGEELGERFVPQSAYRIDRITDTEIELGVYSLPEKKLEQTIILKRKSKGIKI